MTAEPGPDPFDVKVDRLCRSSRKAFGNPYQAFVWPDALDPGCWYTSPELVSIHGTETWDGLDAEGRKRVAFWDAVNFYSLNIHGERSLMQGLGTSAVRLMVTLDRILEPDRVSPRVAPPVRRSPSGARLELHGVTFAYGPHAEPVIAGLDLVVAEGDHLAVVGPSGIGKSTLAALITGMLPPSEGKILIGGVRADHVELAPNPLDEVPGALAAAARLAFASGARLAWVPRRAGERGAVEAGALPGLLPIGRRVTDIAARTEVARAWGKSSLPSTLGRDTTAMLAAAADGELGALVVAGVDPADLPDPQAALRAIEMAPFVVSLELRASAVTDRADVVFPVAAVAEKAGTFVNWEGRGGSFGAALRVPEVRTDLYVLGAIADQMDVHLGLPDAAAARAELAALGSWRGTRADPPAATTAWPTATSAQTSSGLDVLLASWHQLLDSGRMQAGEPALAGTARPVVARMSAVTAAEAGLADGDKVTVATDHGSVAVPVELVPMADHVVWLPAAGLPGGTTLRAELGAGHGAMVTLRRPE